MKRVFVDTAAWIALINEDDDLHTRAHEVLKQLRQRKARLLTTEFVLLEVADAFCSPPFRGKAITYLNGLRQMKHLHIVPIKQQLLNDAWTLFCQRPDKRWGLTDCTSFVTMTQEQIVEAFTSDHHYDQSGFIKLM